MFPSVLVAILLFGQTGSTNHSLHLEGLTVTPHIQSPVMKYRRPPEPEKGARIECFLLNRSPVPIRIDSGLGWTIDGKTAGEWLKSGEWAWHDTPSERKDQSFDLPPGAMTVWSFNTRKSTWGVGTSHTLEFGNHKTPMKFDEPRTWISSLTFLGNESEARPARMVAHVANGGLEKQTITGCRLWLPGESKTYFILKPGPFFPLDGTRNSDGVIPPREKSAIVFETGLLPLTLGAVEINLKDGMGQPSSLWAWLRLKKDSFDISGGWIADTIHGHNTLTLAPYLKTLSRLHINTGQIDTVAGYTDNSELYRKYPFKLFNRLMPLDRTDTDEMLPRIHAVEFLGEPQYGGGKPVPPQKVLEAFRPYQGSRLPTSVTHSEERIWREYAGLSDFPHFDAYRVAAPAADAWGLYDRWGGERIRWGAPLETIGELTRSLRDLNRPKPIAYWSQGAHDGWGSRQRRGSPTPDELRAQAYHALGSRITSLYWFNLSLKSLVKYRDLIEPINRVNREIRLLDHLLLEGDAGESKTLKGPKGPEWELASVIGSRGGVFFVHDIGYSIDPQNRVFQFTPRRGSFTFSLPWSWKNPSEVFRIDADGVHEVTWNFRDGILTLNDQITVAGMYVAAKGPGLKAAAIRRHKELLEKETACGFDPARSDQDFATLKSLLEKSGNE